MLATEPKFGVARLNNNNYQLWKYRLEMILSKENLWEIISDPTPLVPTPEWNTKNRHAMATISLMVEDGQLVHIRKSTTARQMWEELKKLHERTNLTSKLYLLRKLYKARLEEGQNMRTHIDRILEIVEQLRGIGETLKDNHIAALLLCSVPETYETLITALEARPEDELTLDYVKGKLIDEHDRRRYNEQDNDKAEAVLKTEYNRRDKRDLREPKTCYHCGKPGHIRRYCRALREPPIRPNYNARAAVTNERTQNGENELSHEQMDEYLFSVSEKKVSQGWFIDSGATSHMTSNETFFEEINLFPRPTNVLLADGSHIEVTGSGSGSIFSNDSGHKIKITLQNVLHVPKLEGNLMSVKKLAELGYKTIFAGNECKIKKGETTIITAQLDNNLYKLNCSNLALVANQITHSECIHKWHRRLGHRNPDAIKLLINKNLATGLNCSKCDTMQLCKECIKSKKTVKPFPRVSQTRANRPYILLHSDICGPMQTETPGGNKYIGTIIDDHSRYCETFLLKTKDEMNSKTMQYLKRWNNVFGRSPQTLRTDGGGEFLNNEMNACLAHYGIQRQTTIAYSPQQNGVAERKNRSLIEMTRSMLLDAKLDNKYWGEAICTATYIQNRLPTRSCELTPYELWFGNKPDLAHLKVFGSTAYFRVPNEKLKKLDSRTHTGIMLGYSEFSKGYRILSLKTGKVVLSRSVTFDENKNSEEKENSFAPHGEIPECLDELKIPQTEATLETEMIKIEQNEVNQPDPIRRSSRANKGIPAERFAYKAEIVQEYEPDSWSEIMSLDKNSKKEWEAAIDNELESFKQNETWELTELPSGKKAIGCKWVFRIKHDSTGNVRKYKARLVAKGYTQKAGEDYFETYAPVTKYTTLRSLLTIAASRDMETRHLDVDSAFLYGKLEEEIFMEQPEGQTIPGKENLVYKLKKAVYGLKQSANTWYSQINKVLLSNGYIGGMADQCLYTKNKDGILSHILIYVDDLLVCSDSNEQINCIQEVLEKNFRMKNLGSVSYYLGIRIQNLGNQNYFLDQSSKILALIKSLDLEDAKAVQTPMETDFLKSNEDSNPLPNQDKYRSAMGSLLYISTVTRPDIAAAVNLLGRKTSNPSQRDWGAMKRVVKYLKTTADMGLLLGNSKGSTLEGYADADWGGDESDRKSTSGYAFFLNGSLVSWACRKQTCVSLSSTEAEYIAAASACQELLWLRLLLKDFGMEQMDPTILNEDNQGCIKLITIEKYRARSKHIDIKYHLIRDLERNRIIHLNYCPTEMMVADIFTKPLGRERYEKLKNLLNLKCKNDLLKGSVGKATEELTLLEL